MKIIKENQNTKAVNLENMNVDFEEGLLNAITNRFPNVKIKSCLFHLKQVFRRKTRYVKFCSKFQIKINKKNQL